MGSYIARWKSLLELLPPHCWLMALPDELLGALRFAFPVFMSWSFSYSRFSVESRLCPENSDLALLFLNFGELVEKVRGTCAGLTAGPKTGCTVSQAQSNG